MKLLHRSPHHTHTLNNSKQLSNQPQMCNPSLWVDDQYITNCPFHQVSYYYFKFYIFIHKALDLWNEAVRTINVFQLHFVKCIFSNESVRTKRSFGKQFFVIFFCRLCFQSCMICPHACQIKHSKCVLPSIKLKAGSACVKQPAVMFIEVFANLRTCFYHTGAGLQDFPPSCWIWNHWWSAWRWYSSLSLYLCHFSEVFLIHFVFWRIGQAVSQSKSHCGKSWYW